MSEVDISGLINVQQAIAIIDAVAIYPRVEKVALRQALGLRLARDVAADRDYPPFDKSLMDGYALRAADVARAESELNVIGEIPAGGQFPGSIQSGQSIGIMTGAPMPSGADTVIPIEQVELLDGGKKIRTAAAIAPGKNIARQGNEVRKGEIVLHAGQLIGPAQLAVAATVGAANLDVYCRPRVAILSTGDEVVPFDQSPGASQIRNSNNIMLTGLLTQLACDTTDLGIIPDQPDKIRAAIQNALTYDALFISGGMSMGQFDFVPQILLELGVNLKITKLKIRPGKPFVFGLKSTSNQQPATSNYSYIFGLPGNPVSGFVCTVRLASRLIQRLVGAKVVHENWIEAKLAEPLQSNGPREFYQPVSVENGHVRALNWKGSGDVFTLAKANGLLVRAENEPVQTQGATVRVLGF